MFPPPSETSPRVAVTDSVRAHLATELEQHASRAAFRMRYGSDSRASIVLSQPTDDDVLVRHEGDVVLAIEPDLAESLAGKTVDLERTRDGVRVLILG